MQEYSETAWGIASKYSHVLASETRDLATWIDKVIADERERCAKLADPPLMHRKGNVGLWRRRRAQIAADIRDTP